MNKNDTNFINKVLTHSSNKEKAKSLIQNTFELKLDRRTLESALLRSNDGSRRSHDVDNLDYLEFSGLVEDHLASEGTGQLFHHGVRFHNIKDPTQTFTFGWPTSLKLKEVCNKSGINNLNIMSEYLSRSDSDFKLVKSTIDKDYASNINQLLSGIKKISDVQSSKEKRLIQGVLGLEEVLGTIDNITSDALLETLKSNPDKFSSIYQQIYASSGNPITQLKENLEILPADLKDKINLVTKGKKLLSPQQYATFQIELRQFRDYAIPQPLNGESKRYFNDLKILLEDKSIILKGKEALTLINKLEQGDSMTTIMGLTGLFYSADIPSKRLERAMNYLRSNKNYFFDFNKGADFGTKLFVENGSFVGNTNDSVPKNITDKIKYIAKRGDSNIQDVQSFQRNLFVASTIPDVFKTQTIDESENTIKSSIIIYRKNKALSSKDRNIDKYKLADKNYITNENFEKTENISINDIYLRLIDRFFFSKEQFPKFETSFPEELFNSIKQSDLTGIIKEDDVKYINELNQYNLIKSMKEWNDVDILNNEKTNKTKFHPGINKPAYLSDNIQKAKFLTPDESNFLSTYASLIDLVSADFSWFDYKSNIQKYNSLFEYNKYYSHKHKIITFTENNKIKGWRDDYKPSKKYTNSFNDIENVYFDPNKIKSLDEEMNNLIPLTSDLIDKVKEIPLEYIDYNTKKTFEKFANPQGSWDGSDYVEKKLVDKINETYNRINDVSEL